VSINPTYTKLFSPYTFPAGDLTVRNRLALAQSTTSDDVEFLDRHSPDAGMVITGVCRVVDQRRTFPAEWSCANNSTIPDLSRVADAIHRGLALAVLQLHHPIALVPLVPLHRHRMARNQATASSEGEGDHVETMTEKEIEAAITAFGQGARRAIEAGFDAVEIDGARGGLLQEFFSAKTNHRSDQWGGSVENRAGFPIAVVEEIQNVVRRYAYRPFAIGYRLSPEEIETPGITMEETMQLVEGLVACRPDWIHVVTEDYFAGSLRNSGDNRPRAAIIAEGVAGRSGVIGTGSIDTPSLAMRALDDGLSLVALGGSLVSDPRLAEKILAVDNKDISFDTAIME
jgi:2,4-dienoyl-CoA reductase-like NADH-dependent reductase (Old Yellow Enzyme family)